MEEQTKPNLIEMAKKRRHLALVEKLAKGKSSTPSLSRSEIHELERFELPPGSPAIVDTQEKVAKAFNVAVRTVQRWQRDGMPLTSDKRYDLADIQAWRIVNRKRKKSKQGSKEHWDTQFREFKARLAEIEYKKELGELIPKKDVEQAFIHRIITIKRGLLALPRYLPPQLKGMDAREIENILRTHIEELIDNFSKGGKLSKLKYEKRNTRRVASRRA